MLTYTNVDKIGTFHVLHNQDELLRKRCFEPGTGNCERRILKIFWNGYIQS